MINHSSPYISQEDIEQVCHQLVSKNIANGETVKIFEKNLREFLHVPYLYTTSNGTNALFLALKALNLKKGAEIILPTYVCHNVLEAVIQARLKPILCDIGKSWIVTPANIEDVFTSRSRCLILVHPMGISLDTEKFKHFGIPIIEDFCQNFGGQLGNAQIVLKGDIGVYSFHATKCLTTGEGGALATNNGQINGDIKRLLKLKAQRNPLSDLQACLGINQLDKYKQMLSRRKYIADLYFQNLRPDLTKSFSLFKNDSIYFRFLLWKEDVHFPKKKHQFEQNDIAIRKGIDTLLHYSFKSKRTFPNSEKALANTISIPIYPDLEEVSIQKIITFVNNIL